MMECSLWLGGECAVQKLPQVAESLQTPWQMDKGSCTGWITASHGSGCSNFLWTARGFSALHLCHKNRM